MRRSLRLRALTIIGATRACLATYGPAGLQASIISCHVRGECLYLLLPASADHLFNLERALELSLTAEDWQVRGLGVCVLQRQHLGCAGPRDLVAQASSAGQVLVEVVPLQIHLGLAGSPIYRETLDFSSAPLEPAADGQG
jgi:hypothetical protein